MRVASAFTVLLVASALSCASSPRPPAPEPRPPAPLPTADPGTLYDGACAASRAGDVDEALVLLRAAVDAGFDRLLWMDADPDLAAVRADPRYISLRDAAFDRAAAAVSPDAPARDHVRIGALRTLQGRPDDVRAALLRAYQRGFRHFVFEPRVDPGAGFDAPEWREGVARRDAWGAANAGHMRVAVPDVYELANVVLSLTRYARGLDYAINRSSAYHDEVAAWFGSASGHPLIAALDAEPLDVNGFYGFRNNALGYGFEGDRLVPTGVYYQDGATSVLHPRDLFTRHLALVEDFARTARWSAFRDAHDGYYRAIEASFAAAVPLDEVRAWLDARFPGGGHDAYAIYFSPLTAGFHNGSVHRHGDLSEALMATAGPHTAGELDPVAAAALARIVFTEIDHTYVDAVSQRRQADIERVLAPRLDAWNTQDGYRSARQTFDEHLTWALFDLWFTERCEALRCDEGLVNVVLGQSDSRMTQRGFPRYAGFRDALLAVAAGAPRDAPIAGRYDALLAWMDGQGKAAAPVR